MEKFIITDSTLPLLIRHAGFSCENVWKDWYETDVPVPFNETYQLNNSITLISHGTGLYEQGSTYEKEYLQKAKEQDRKQKHRRDEREKERERKYKERLQKR